MDPEKNKGQEFNLLDFKSTCNSIREIDGSFRQDLLLPFFVNTYLVPSFYIDHPEQWREGVEILLKHVNTRGFGTTKRENAVRLLATVFNKEEEIRVNGDVEVVKQGDIIREEQEDIHYTSMKIMREYANSESSISPMATDVLDSYGEGS